ncbi:hypothetical protein DI43_05380 [Geobacillus sp. CAMR12739]|nr:hypothetical protein DI43_05380 [Geobacillus sp. CAMR12739]
MLERSPTYAHAWKWGSSRREMKKAKEAPLSFSCRKKEVFLSFCAAKKRNAIKKSEYINSGGIIHLFI